VDELNIVTTVAYKAVPTADHSILSLWPVLW